MVITCPSCSARYRLNPQKIAGRGAKITCPKCAHVFVIFTESGATGEDASVGETGERVSSASGRSSALDPPPPPPPKDPGDDKISGSHEVQAIKGSMSATGSVRIVAPGARKRRSGGLATGSMSAISSRVTGSSTGLRPVAVDLDFREVGITTWKVKVAIGLVYDFSDVGTLRKYLDEKKVTPDDLISHDGKEWKKIAEIPDLDAHFVEVYEAAKAVKEGRAPPSSSSTTKSSSSTTTSRGGGATSSSTASMSSTTSSRSTSTSSRSSRGSAGGATAARRRAAKKAEEETASGNKTWMIAVAIVALVGGGYWFSQRESGSSGASAEIAQSAAGAGAEDAAREGDAKSPQQRAIEAQIERDLAEQAAKITAETQAKALAEEEADQEADFADYVPVVQRAGGGEPVKRPRYEPQNTPPPTRTPQRLPPQSHGSKDPSQSYYKLCVKKLGSGDYGSALKGCQKATALNASCGKCWKALGQAHEKLGNSTDAAAAYKKAKDLGS